MHYGKQSCPAGTTLIYFGRVAGALPCVCECVSVCECECECVCECVCV